MKWESYSHPISDIREWSDDKRLELRPDFQRNEVWTPAAQIMLIDTILKGIPIPKIYIKTTVKNDKTYRVVIDGQQRLTTFVILLNEIIEFGGDSSAKRHCFTVLIFSKEFHSSNITCWLWKAYYKIFRK